MAIVGLGNGLFFAARTPIVVALVEPIALTRAFSVRFLANSVGAGLGAVSAGFLLSVAHWPFSTVLLIDAATFVVFAAVIGVVAPKGARATGGEPDRCRRTTRRKRLRAILTARVLRLICAHTLIAFFCITQLDSTVPVALNAALHLSYATIGSIIGATSLVAVLVQLPIGRLVEVLGDVRSFTLQGALWCAAWLAGFLALLFPAATVPLVIIMMVSVCVAECVFNPAMNNLVVKFSAASTIGRVNGIVSSSFSASLAWGPSLGFLLLGAGGSLYWLALLAGAALALSFTFGLDRRRGARDEDADVANPAPA